LSIVSGAMANELTMTPVRDERDRAPDAAQRAAIAA
jgi:hypothetical protein